MYILCDKTASFYSKIKNVINIPIVICSTGLSILNTINFSDNVDKMLIISYISTAFNLLIALSIAILNLYKIPEKEYSFKSHSMNFLKLNNKINAEITKCRTIMQEIDIISIINEYNLLCEYITFHIPSHIRKDIQKNYAKYKLPLLLTNNKKDSYNHKILSKYVKYIIQNTQHNINILDDKISSISSDCMSIEMDSSASAKENAIIPIKKPKLVIYPGLVSFDESPFSVLANNVQYSPLFATKTNKRNMPIRNR
jgi:hypothetical protein